MRLDRRLFWWEEEVSPRSDSSTDGGLLGSADMEKNCMGPHGLFLQPLRGGRLETLGPPLRVHVRTVWEWFGPRRTLSCLEQAEPDCHRRANLVVTKVQTTAL